MVQFFCQKLKFSSCHHNFPVAIKILTVAKQAWQLPDLDDWQPNLQHCSSLPLPNSFRSSKLLTGKIVNHPRRGLEFNCDYHSFGCAGSAPRNSHFCANVNLGLFARDPLFTSKLLPWAVLCRRLPVTEASEAHFYSQKTHSTSSARNYD